MVIDLHHCKRFRINCSQRVEQILWQFLRMELISEFDLINAIECFAQIYFQDPEKPFAVLTDMHESVHAFTILTSEP